MPGIGAGQRWGWWCVLWWIGGVGVLSAGEGTPSLPRGERLKYQTLSRLEQALVEEKSLESLMTTLKGLDQSQAAVPTLLHGLKNAAPKNADRIIAVLGDIYPPHDDVIAALFEASVAGNVPATSGLARFGPVIFPAIRRQLDSQDPVRCRAAFLVLQEMADRNYPHADYREFAPAAARWLKSEKLAERALASWTLRAFGGSAKDVIPALIEALQDDDAGVVLVAIDVLGRIGPDAEAAIPALSQLPNANVNVIRVLRAIESLGQMGPAAVAPLVELLSHRSEQVRAMAARSLGRMGPDAQGSVAEVRRLLADPDWKVCAEAAIAVWHLSGDVGPLAPALSEAVDHDVQFAALRVIRLGPAGRCLVEELAGQLERTAEPEVRRQLLTAIGAVGPEAAEVIPVLMQQLANDRDDIAVKRALARIGPAARKVLVEALKSEDSEVRMDAVAALGEMGWEARVIVPDLIRIAERAMGEAQEEAYSALAEIITDQGVQVYYTELLELAERDEAVENVLKAIIKVQGGDVSRGLEPAFQSLLERELNDYIAGLSKAESAERLRAADNLLQYGRFGKPAVPQLRLALEDDDLHVRQHVAAALWAAEVPDEQPRQILIAGLHHPHPRIRMQVATLFRSVGPAAAPAVSHLVELLSEPLAEIRVIAAAAIAGIDPDQPDLIPALMNLLEDTHVQSSHRVRAAGILKTLGPRAKTQLPRLRRLQFLEEDLAILEALIDAQRRIEGAVE